MAAAVLIVFIVLLQCFFQSSFGEQKNAELNKRSFATNELREPMREKVCPDGYYRSWCMSECEKCAEPTTSYERLLRTCTDTQNSIVACKDDADGEDGLCTPSHAVKLDCDGAVDPRATSTAPGHVTKEMTQVAETTVAPTGSGILYSSHPFSTDLESLSQSEEEQPPSKSGSTGSKTMGEYQSEENAKVII